MPRKLTAGYIVLADGEPMNFWRHNGHCGFELADHAAHLFATRRAVDVAVRDARRTWDALNVVWRPKKLCIVRLVSEAKP